MPITLSGKKYLQVYVLTKVCVLNKQVSKYLVMAFLSKLSVFSFLLTGYGFVLSCMHFVHLQYIVLLVHSKPGYN